MSLTSQLITETFPDLDKVERLNTEAFPEEERIPLSEFLRYTDNDDAHFFAFYNEEEFVGFAFAISNAKAFYVSFFAIMPHLRSHGYGQEIIEKLVDIYEKDGRFNEKINLQKDLTVMLFVGVNGVGKTTSIGKLAYKYKQEGKKVMLVAADTFRAGAVAQLAEWGRRVDVPVVTGPEKSDPASVVFDGLERAKAENVDILMIDTAGRLQNKDNLMAELEKIGRIIKRVDPAAPHETFLALDASTGQNALVQAEEFSKITPVTGIVLTKIDGTARGGVVLAIRQELDIPVKLIGFGEKIDDIGEFNSENFMRGLLEGLV